MKKLLFPLRPVLLYSLFILKLFAEGQTPALRSEVLFTRPEGSFFESIAMDSKGVMYLTERSEHLIYRIQPYGGIQAFAKAPQGASLTGLAINAEDQIYISGKNAEGHEAIFHLTDRGSLHQIADLPQAVFLNGATFLPDNRLLVVDSKIGAQTETERGEIYEIDLSNGKVRLFFSHELLGKESAKNLGFPAVNGIKFHKGALYMSNSERAVILKLSLDQKLQPLHLKVLANNLVGDDFAVSPDGRLFIATHAMNSLVELDPSTGKQRNLAGQQEGMTGSTAVSLVQHGKSPATLYVVTNGGSYIPPESGVEPAKLVRIDLQSHEVPVQSRKTEASP